MLLYNFLPFVKICSASVLLFYYTCFFAFLVVGARFEKTGVFTRRRSSILYASINFGRSLLARRTTNIASRFEIRKYAAIAGYVRQDSRLRFSRRIEFVLRAVCVSSRELVCHFRPHPNLQIFIEHCVEHRIIYRPKY